MMAYKRDERFGAKLSKAPAVAPCENSIGVHQTVLYMGNYVCALCRWSLVETTMMADEIQAFSHNRPIPMEAQDLLKFIKEG